MTPTIGRIVLFSRTGSPECPAIVTRVWSDTCINVTTFPDCAPPVPASSVVMTEDFEASGQSIGWRWMPYQKAVAAGEIAPTLHAVS